MSDEQQNQITTPSPLDPLKSGLGWVAKHWPRIRLGHEGMMLEKIDRQNRIAQTLARNSMTGNMGDVAGWPGDEGDDKMGVSIGDHVHYHQSVEPRPPATVPPATPAPTAESPWSQWLPYIMAAALGAGGYYVGNQQTTIQQPTPVVSDREAYGIQLRHYVPESIKPAEGSP